LDTEKFIWWYNCVGVARKSYKVGVKKMKNVCFGFKTFIFYFKVFDQQIYAQFDGSST
jgi:hypothetical protein